MRHPTPKPLPINEVVERIGARTNVDTLDVRHVLDELADLIPEVVADGHSVELFGLGVFSRTTRKGRWIRDPRGGGSMWLDETTTVRFSAAKAAKARVR